jgi:hypothetical protein
MVNRKVILFLILSSATLYYLPLTSVTKLGVFVLAAIILLIYQQLKFEKRLFAVENTLSTTGDGPRSLRELDERSYSLEVIVAPNWEAILAKLGKEHTLSEHELLSRFKSQDGTINPGGWGLWGRSFRFVLFQDQVSGASQIWSDHHRSFIGNMAVSGWIFESALASHAFEGAITRKWIFAPEGIGSTQGWDPGGDIESSLEIGEMLASIPFWEIVRFLLELDQHMGGMAMHAVKRFPSPLQKRLDDIGTKYSTDDYSGRQFDTKFDTEVLSLVYAAKWAEERGIELYRQELVFHTFEAVCYSVKVRLRGYQSACLRQVNTDKVSAT